MNENLPPLWNSKSLREAIEVQVPDGLEVMHLSIDSRTIKAGELFVALKGEYHNGNEFAIGALRNGAAACIVDEMLPGMEQYVSQVILVENALEALNKLAKASRRRTGAKVIAVTGSVGKTTTKELLHIALGASDDVYVSHGNFNNHYGLPLCLANMPQHVKYAVFELGMNHEGEIRHLTKIVEPDVALITRVSAAHLEFFSSVDSIAAAKAEIYEGMKPGKHAVINYDDPTHPILVEKAKAAGLQIVSFGSDAACDASLEEYNIVDGNANIKAKILGNKYNYVMHIYGRHMAMNSIGALAAVACAGADVGYATAKGVSQFRMQKGRGQILYNPRDKLTIIDDSYNASPASVRAALDSMRNVCDKGRMIVVLGDMRELGDSAWELHTALKSHIQAAGVEKVFCVGELMLHLYNALPAELQGGYGVVCEEIIPQLKQQLKAGDVILVKGSNSMRMRSVVDAIV